MDWGGGVILLAVEETDKSRFIGVNIRQSAEKKKGTGPFSIALFHNLIFVDTGDKCKSGLFEVNQAGGVYEAHGEDFSFEPFRQPVHSAGKVFSGRYNWFGTRGFLSG